VERYSNNMPARTEEAEAWFAAVYMAVQEVPVGKVTTYGHIARLIGHRKYFILERLLTLTMSKLKDLDKLASH